MPSESYRDYLDEWEAGAFYTCAFLSECFHNVLTRLQTELANSDPDPRLEFFLEQAIDPYLSYMEISRRLDWTTYDLYEKAMAMLGRGVTTRRQLRQAELSADSPARKRPRGVAPALTPAPATPALVAPALSPRGRVCPRTPDPQPGPSSAPGGTPPPSPRPGSSSAPGGTPPPSPRKRPLDQDESDCSEEGVKRPRLDDGAEGLAAVPTIEVLASTERNMTRFKTVFREEVFAIHGLGRKSADIDAHVVSLFDTLLNRQKEAVNARPEDRAMIEIRSSDNMGTPLWYSLRRSDQLSGVVLADRLKMVLNSNEGFLTSGSLHFSYIHVPAVGTGGRGRRIANEDTERWLIRKSKSGSSSIYNPQNSDQMCLARCLAFMTTQKSVTKQERCKLKKPNSKVIEKLALDLCRTAGVDHTKPSGMDEVKLFQSILGHHRLIVFTSHDPSIPPVFSGPRSSPDEPRDNLCLLLNENHFYGIISMTGAFDQSYFCEKCLKFYNNKNVHKCAECCWRCDGEVEHVSDMLKRCKDCNKFFAGEECFESHKNVYRGTSNCEKLKFCMVCDKTYNVLHCAANKKHRCNFIVCKYCKLHVPENHKCYMTEWKPRKINDKTRYIRLYFDIETNQSYEIEGRPGSYEHKPNLLISQHVCQKCESEKDVTVYCNSCGQRENIFQAFHNKSAAESPTVVTQFFNFLIQLTTEKKTEVTLFAHNLKSFDGYFIVQECINRNLKPKVVMQGAKIISLKLPQLHFKDSLMFLPQRLSALPKSFGLHELKKGYFCHLANQSEYYNYCGPMPAPDLYCTSTMSVDELNKFKLWYQEQIDKNYVFDFKKEIISYCQSDVQILREAMESFRSLFIESSDFDPLHNCITLSSACMAMYRKNHMQEYSIAIAPRGGYRGVDKGSYEALKWLDYCQHLLGDVAQIRTAENGREVKILKHPVDGYVEVKLPCGKIQKNIYQYHGCYWHHCTKCFPNESVRAKLRGPNRNDAYEKTRRITELFRRNGYIVNEIWGCEFKKEMENNVEMQTYFKNNPVTRSTPLNIRDGICGGRTSAIYSYLKADIEKGEKIKFFDVCSEYPSCNYKSKYPALHPDIYLGNDPNLPDVKDWNGMAKLTVLAPQDLYLPVLPHKCHSKLMFPLCKTCVENNIQTPLKCGHTPEERMLEGTWCWPEIELALEKGYKIIKIHEVHQYPETRQYDPVTKSEGLFSSYVRANMAQKIESSGWPTSVSTDEEQDNYIRMHFEKDGIVIKKENVKKNPGKRTLAKLILNSFWGKLGERTLRSQSDFVSTYEELARLVEDSTLLINSILPVSDEMLQVNYTPIDETEDSLPTTSLVHAAFTTAHGRVLLYRYLDIVEERAAYHDTDSICFLSRPGFPDPPLGSYLGELTDQLADDYGENSFCTEFVSAGAKNYAYRVAVNGDLNNIKTVIKVRGITINSSCADVVTFDNLKSMVLEKSDPTRVHIPTKIVRTPDWRIISRKGVISWGVHYKGVVIDNRIVPHGYTGALLNSEDYDLGALLIKCANE